MKKFSKEKLSAFRQSIGEPRQILVLTEYKRTGSHLKNLELPKSFFYL